MAEELDHTGPPAGLEPMGNPSATFTLPTMDGPDFPAIQYRISIATSQIQLAARLSTVPPSHIRSERAMSTFIVNEKVSGTLLPLADLIERMPFDDITSWRFRDIYLHGYGRPFGLTFDEFEGASRQLPGGFEVTDDEFRAFLEADFQIIDGIIEAWANGPPPRCVVCFDCEDSSQWEITTDRPELSRNFEAPVLSRHDDS